MVRQLRTITISPAVGSFLSASRIAALAAVCLCLGACRQARSSETPSIVFTTVPEAAESGGEKVAVVAGRVTGARAGQRLVLFAKSAVWWVQPFIAEPFTEIKTDST